MWRLIESHFLNDYCFNDDDDDDDDDDGGGGGSNQKFQMLATVNGNKS